MMRSGPSPLLVKPSRDIPDAVVGRSCGWMVLDLSDRGAGSNSFDWGGYARDLGNAEENSDGLRTSAMMMEGEAEDGDKDESDFADYLSDSSRALLRPAPRGSGKASAWVNRPLTMWRYLNWLSARSWQQNQHLTASIPRKTLGLS